MEVQIENMQIEQKSVLRNLIELYEYDFTEFESRDVNEHALFGYKYIDHYWTDDGRYPLLIRVDEKIAGFVLVRTAKENPEKVYYSIAEFFIMKKYRRKGVGTIIARKVFEMFVGEWHVFQTKENLPAKVFWRKVIGGYTDGKYDEVTNVDGTIQMFVSEGDNADGAFGVGKTSVASGNN